MDESLMLYHIVRGAHAAVGHLERNPFSRNDRRTTLEELKMKIKTLAPRNLRAIANENLVNELFARADILFRDKEQKLSTESTVPAPPPRPLRSVEPKPEISTLTDFKPLVSLANAKFAFDKRQRRKAGIIQTRKRNEIQESLNACRRHATRLPEPISGEVSIRKHGEYKEVEKLWMSRDPQKVTETSNLICEGYFHLELNKKETARVNWEMNADGELHIKLGDQTVGRERFNSENLTNLFLELHKLVAGGLRDCLVRQETERKEKERRARATAQQAEVTRPSSETPRIHPRSTGGMFVIEEEDTDEKPKPDEPIAHGPLIPRETERILKLLKKTDPITDEDVVNLRLFQEEIIDVADNGHGAKAAAVYVPVGDVRATLEEIQTGISPVQGMPPLTTSNIFLVKQVGVLKRAGYQPWIATKKPGALNYTQRRPNPTSSATRQHLERRTLGQLELDIPEARQMLRVRAGSEINQIMIRTRNGIEQREILLLTDDLALLKEGYRFEDGLSEGAGRVELGRGIRANEVQKPIDGVMETVGYNIEAILRVPQIAQYMQGSFISLAEAEVLLKTQESHESAIPAAI